MRRLLDFLRSLLPADLTQLIFLSGIVSLIAGAQMRWWPADAFSDLPTRFSEQSRLSLGIFVMLARMPIVFAVAAGYYFCLWSVLRPLRRIWLCVWFPALATIGLICGRFLYLHQGPQASVFERSPWLPHDLHNGFAVLWSLGLGFRFTLFGLALMAVYMSRLTFGISNLPVALPTVSRVTGDDDIEWHPTRRLIWFLLAWCYVVTNLTSETVTTGIALVTQFAARPPRPWVYYVSDSIGALALVLVATLLIGTSGSQEVQHAVSWCSPWYLVLGALFAFGVNVFISTGQYAADRIAWAAYSFGMHDPPEFSAYFKVPGAILLVLFFAALGEEIIFRGFLLQRLIARYGLYRGLCLVGIVFAAFHFYSDFSQLSGVQQLLLRFGFRIADGVAFTWVLAWLTLRSGSVLPAAITHTVTNVFVFSPLGPPFQWRYPVRIVLWAVLAYALFRYWPVQANNRAEPVLGDPRVDHPQVEPE